jgi:hypothetical protein
MAELTSTNVMKNISTSNDVNLFESITNVQRSLSNKSHREMATSSSSAMIVDQHDVESILTRTEPMLNNSSDEIRAATESEMLQSLLAELKRHRSYRRAANDSFDDEDDLILDDPLSQLQTSSQFSMTCPICLESTQLRISSCCSFSFCNYCWLAHISAAINDGRIQIPCASSSCTKYISRETILSLIQHDDSLHDHYLKLYTIANQNERRKTCV